MRLEANKEEVEKVNAFWKGKADQVLKPVPENWSGSMVQHTPWKFNYKKKLWPCSGMWNTLDFLTDGSVALCCRDYDGTVILGNINNASVAEIMQKKRELGYCHLREDYSRTPICIRCDTSIKNATSWL